MKNVKRNLNKFFKTISTKNSSKFFSVPDLTGMVANTNDFLAITDCQNKNDNNNNIKINKIVSLILINHILT